MATPISPLSLGNNFGVYDIHVDGWRHAIYGMRKSFNSEHICDSEWHADGTLKRLGRRDLITMQFLAHGSASERKFARAIHVQCDIRAPLYWWKQFDTYKVGTTTLSQSTMHTLMRNELTMDDFATDLYPIFEQIRPLLDSPTEALKEYINVLDQFIMSWNKTTDPGNRRVLELVLYSMLPDGYLQTRMVDMNYETCWHIYNDRLNHKLPEWHDLCTYFRKDLPYFDDIFLGGSIEKEKENDKLG